MRRKQPFATHKKYITPIAATQFSPTMHKYAKKEHALFQKKAHTDALIGLFNCVAYKL